MFRAVGLRRLESQVKQTVMMEGNKEAKAGLRVIRGRERLETRFIEEERKERMNKIKVEI
jgi:hypothetical protein